MIFFLCTVDRPESIVAIFREWSDEKDTDRNENVQQIQIELDSKLPPDNLVTLW